MPTALIGHVFNSSRFGADPQQAGKVRTCLRRAVGMAPGAIAGPSISMHGHPVRIRDRRRIESIVSQSSRAMVGLHSDWR
jgi:hypothetical protein